MAFSGRAVDSAGAFAGQPEDVTDLITIISPTETPFLSRIGDSDFSAKRVLHEWLEDRLAPNAVKVTGGVTSLAGGASDTWSINGDAAFLQEGTLLRGPDAAGGEYVRVTSVFAPNSIVVTRGFGGTSVNSSAAADYWQVIATAQPDARDVARDISRSRSRVFNYTHEFMVDIIIAGAEQAVLHIGIDDEWDYQVRQRTREALIGLERAALLSVWSLNSIGGANSVRTMKGLLQAISTNSASYGSGDLATVESNLNAMIQAAWLQGGTDLDVVMPGVGVKKQMDQLNASRTRTVNADGRFVNRVNIFENTFGTYEIMMNRWMPSNRVIAMATGRLKVAPLINRSFHAKRVGDTGDSMKGYVLGEYTLEYRNEAGMAQGYFPGLSLAITP